MWMVRPLSFLGLIGLFNSPQLSLSAGFGGPDAGDCPDELCGENGAGSCTRAGEGRVCVCKEGFSALLLSSGAACVHVEGPVDNLPRQDIDEGTDWTGEFGDATEGTGDFLPGLVTPPGSGDHAEEGFGDNEAPSADSTGPIDLGETTGACADHPCGDPAAASCVVRDHGYMCLCNEGFVPVTVDGRQVCANEADTVCAGNPCQPGHTCVPLGETYRCNCASGYHSSVQTADGEPTCVADAERDVCRDDACGPPEGVRGCLTGEDGGRVCFCNSGFIPKIGADGATQCAEETTVKESYPGVPRPGAEEGVLVGPGTGEIGSGNLPAGGIYGPGTEAGGAHGPAVLPTGGYGPEMKGAEATGGPGGGLPGRPVEEMGREGGAAGGATGGGKGAAGGGTEGEDHRKEGGGNGTLIAGGVIGAVILAAAAGGGAAIYKHRQSSGGSSTSDEVDFEQSGHEAMVDVEPDESEILINVTNADWAS